MSWLVTGGAGFIGSHVVSELSKAGITPVVLDDFSTGKSEFLNPEVQILRGSLIDEEFVSSIDASEIKGVIHLAGYKYAGESVKKPLLTYQQNVLGTHNLLQFIEANNIPNLVFSSSAAVYGTPVEPRVTEQTTLHPESPYGETKLIGEWMVNNLVRNQTIKATSLRYFNVVGSGNSGIVDLSPHNLFPLLFKSLQEGKTPHINGINFPTPDGTCVRDYVHVIDIAKAHVSAARKLEAGESLEPAYNLGAGKGTSVKQIMDAAQRVTKINFEPEIRERRDGDPARIVANGELASRDLGWENTFTVDEMLKSAWDAWNSWSK